MKTSALNHLAISATIWLVCSGPASAELRQYDISLDLPSLGIPDSVQHVELQISLDNNNGIPGDSWARVDNVVLGSAIDDFTDPDPFYDPVADPLGKGFETWLNPDHVTREALAGGNGVMRMADVLLDGQDPDEQLAYILTWRDYYDRDGHILTFHVEVDLDPASGFWGGDRLVFFLLDPVTLYPLTSGFRGLGDVAVISREGLSVVPVPGACLLALLGFGSAGLKLRRRNRG